MLEDFSVEKRERRNFMCSGKLEKKILKKYMRHRLYLQRFYKAYSLGDMGPILMNYLRLL